MAFEQKDFSGSIFPNGRKNKPNDPDITGKAMIRGEMFWVSGWHKKTKDGKGWYSLAFKAIDETAQAPTPDDTSTPWD